MKATKKVLSVFLAALMAFSCLTAALPTVASAASSYTAAQVKTAVANAATKINAINSSSNKYTATGDDGTIMKAAEMVYDYAVNTARGGTSYNSSYNSPDTLKDRVTSLTGGNSDALLRLINPNGTTTYGYEKRTSHQKSGSVKRTILQSQSWSDSWASYDTGVPDSVTKTISITSDLDKVLLACNTINDIPATILLNVVYTYTVTNYKYLSKSSKKDWKSTVTWSWTTQKWNYFSAVNRKVNDSNTTARNLMISYGNYFSTSRLNTTMDSLLTQTPAQLTSLYNEATAKYTSFKSDFSTAVINHFIGSAAIESYLTRVEKAMQLVIAKEKMTAMLGYIDQGFTVVTAENYNNKEIIDIDAQQALYANALAAYNAVKDYSQSIFDEVIESSPELAAFSLAASEQFLTDLYDNIDLYNAYMLRDAIDADMAAYADRIADPLNDDDITNLELAALKDKFNGYMTSIGNLHAYARDLVFTADYMDEINAFRTAVQLKIDTRAAEENYEPFYAYFIPYLFANIGAWSNEEIRTRYTADSAKQTSLNSTYNTYKGKIGVELVNAVFTFTYGEEDYLLTTAVADYIARLKANIIARNNEQLEKIKYYSDMSSTITFTNFIGVKAAINALDRDLYSYANGKGWVDAEHKAIYNSISGLLSSYDAFVASGGLNQFKQTHYHDASGLYVTRYAGEQTDAAGNLLGFANDIARAGSDDNYDVNIANVNQTITKLDSFLTSEDFCSLVGLKDKDTQEAYQSLSVAIDKILKENLFTNEMVNTLVGALFPMLCSTIDDLIKNLPNMGINGVYKSSDSQAICAMNLGTLDSSGTVSGVLNVYAGGPHSTNSYKNDFESLGIYIYPNSLASVLPSQYSAIKTALNSAGTNWSNLVGSDGKTPLTFDWKVTDYDSFVTAVGAIFGSILPLLQTVLANKNYSKSLPSNFAYATSSGSMKVKYSGMTLTLTDVKATATASIAINGQTLFKDLWIPVMEALCITDFGYSFGTLSSSASGAQMADAMFAPLLKMIDKLKTQPIDTVLTILPNLLYGLSMDKLQDLLNGVTIPIAIDLEITDFDNAKIDTGVFEITIGITTIANWLKGTINGFIPTFNFDLTLDQINLEDLICKDYTNINSLLAYLFGKLDINLQLPIINAGEIIVCSSYTKTASSYRTGGKRLKFTADKADVFYFLLNYLVNAVGNREFIENIIQFIQDQNADSADADASADPVELPDLVYGIIGNVNANPDMALAALVELFVPQSYSKKQMDWFATDLEYTTDVDNFNVHSVPYLKYNNDWTREKANYFVDHIDEIMESVLAMSGSEITSVNAMLQTVISGLFNNKNFTGLVKELVSLGYTLDNEFVYDLIGRETKVELRTWARAYGYLFPDVLEKYEVTALQPGDTGYTGIAGVSARVGTVQNLLTGEEEETLIWTVNGKDFEDGDRKAFLDLFTTVCGSFAPLVAMMLSGQELSLFNNAITIKGYENYANSIGILFEVLGFNEEESLPDIMTQAEYNTLAKADAAAAFNKLLNQAFDWVDYMLQGNTIAKTVELLPRLVYFMQSNGLSTVLHNMLMPILVLLDDVRPIIDVDINSIVSVILSDVLNAVTDSLGTEEKPEIKIDGDKILNLLAGEYAGDADPDHKFYSVDIGHLTIDAVIKLADTFLGTDIYGSEFIQLGLNGLCAGAKKIENSVIGTAYGASVDAADTISILIPALIEGLNYQVADADNKTNGEIICTFIDSLVDTDVDIPAVYRAVMDILDGLEVSYEAPDWGYMFDGNFEVVDGSVTLPAHSIVYIDEYYDWTAEKAAKLDACFDEFVDLLLKQILKDSTLAELLNSILEDNVYTDANLNAVVELLVNAIAGLDEALYSTVGAVMDINIASWFAMCDPVVDEDGKTTYVCNEPWGVDSAAAGDKKDLFVSSVKKVLEPANGILSWLLFGTPYRFFTGSEKDKDGNYTYNDVITVNGGQGYAYGIIPVLEALDCNAERPVVYANDDGTYDVAKAVEDIFNALLAKIDAISGAPAHEILGMLPNIIYFLNANGIKAAVNSLLAPADALVSALSPVLSADKEPATLAGLLKDTIGMDISDLSMDTLLELLQTNTGIVIDDSMYALLRTFYIGQLQQYESANDEYAYKMTYTDEESGSDMIIIVLSFALDLIKDNQELFGEMLGDNKAVLDTVLELLQFIPNLQAQEPNWFYMAETAPSEDELAGFIADSGKLSAETISYIRDAYSKDGNLWSSASAAFLSDNLVKIIDLIVESKKHADLNSVLKQEFAKGRLYSEYNLQKLGYEIGSLLNQVPGAYRDVIGVVLDLDLDYYKQFTQDPDASLKNQILTESTFASRMVEMLQPIEPLLDWLLFGKDYEFLVDKNGADAIVVKGYAGYQYGLVPILEALQIDIPDMPANACFANMAKPVFLSMMAKIDEVCNAGDGEAALQVMLDHLPNIIYFLNADGLTASVNNLLMGVNALITAAAPVTGMEGDLTDLLNAQIAKTDIPLDLKHIDFKTVSDILAATTGLHIQDAVSVDGWNYLSEIFVGELVPFASQTGNAAYRAMPTADGTTQRDILTVILCAALDVLKYEDNRTCLVGWFGEDTYKGVMNVFDLDPITTHQQLSWMYTDENGICDEYADAVISPMADCSGTFDYGYDEFWTREKATYIAENLNDFVNQTLALLGIQNAEGEMMDSVESLLSSLIGENLYTNNNAAAIAKAVAGLAAEIDAYEDGLISGALKTALNIDLSVYEKYADGKYDFGIAVGDKNAFMDAIVELLVPIAPILRVVLTAENLTLLVDKNGGDAVTVFGAEGYKYAIIPLLEAFDHTNPNIMTADAYAAAAEGDDDALIRNILIPVFSVLDYVIDDPLNNILEILPGIIYFINSNGVDTVVKNLIAPINNVLAAVEPITGKADLYQILGIELADIDMQYLLNMLTDMLNDAESGYAEFVPPVVNAVADMTMGKVEAFTSRNGDPAYTMVYVESENLFADKVDMLTVILRLALSWITMPENQDTVRAFLKDHIENEETEKYVVATYETLVTYLDKPHGVNMMMGLVYYIFYGLDVAVDETTEHLQDTNDKWKFIMNLFDNAESDYLSDVADILHRLFGVTDGVFDEDGVASNGFVPFFQKIINWFKTVIEWFKSLFGTN